MSTGCDCDRKTSNGGVCDNSCPKEPETIFTVESSSATALFAPIVPATKKAAGVFEGTFEATVAVSVESGPAKFHY